MFYKPAPAEWTEFVLMDRFKKSRAEVQAWPLQDGLTALTMLAAETKARKVNG